ncbi:hypothetical protein A2631_05275 [Candidatus Daviesbacteria bacterium RIFCSPHIGHO2_01_FULL_44_29]|uniref:Uncharacterized protein n=1 Tax=Candidatus Daviesbacteria bacterium RIFCSPHIGHO2_02_FULL_43_12 TaxID=1797776 RepID=A0A1F5KH04_9BACT|nr:MAG: hypothetical protein A2631_05275 [Candidatus Daviesbacteria bacterium RIFCSPHIGHO2_01_FULL_44_29]OGE40129.1 MAG: hypothetical protein A3D25_04995 [Candidatus Daviesbacteria bacterium RIFCSPHIGHO2_02_FULL_43_12]OGE70189.1 MAG: hypothetical protein A3B55_00565 [Candidatus Daviesbacteria bacterium RIFCSPLOWO2_01_FULL_43_15]
MNNPGPAGLPQFQQLIQRLINISIPLAFVILTVMLVFAGYKFIQSGGDQKQLQAARGTLQWAVFGIGFTALGWVALKTIENFTGVTLTQFCIGFRPYCL